MERVSQRMEEEAIRWLVDLRRDETADWDKFTEWLEADPRHSTAFDRAALVDQDIERLASTPRTPLFKLAPNRRISRWALAASIASLVALTGVASFLASSGKEPLQTVATAPGAHRTVELADGSRVSLNGGTRVTMDGTRRFARLEEGEALFSVVHDERRPFRVAVDDVVIEDLGTVFNIQRTPNEIAVDVQSGRVAMKSGVEQVVLEEGQSGRRRDGRIEMAGRIRSDIGSWTAGRLVYDGASIEEVAADLSRNLGVAVVASPDTAGAQFTGVIVVDHDRARFFRRLAGLLDMETQQTGDGWVLTRKRR